MINLYRKTPGVISAIQINITTEHDIISWSKGKVFASPVLESTPDNPSGVYWQVDTPEGIKTAITGDYIIKDFNEDFYPCKPDIFEKNYTLII